MRDQLKVWLAILAVFLSLMAPASAGPWEDGLAAWEGRDYGTARRLWLALASQGDSDAQHGIGFMYANGQGVAQDDAEAIRWWREAADRGIALAQGNLAAMYTSGHGVPQDYVQAYKWYDLAAARYPSSQTDRRITALVNRDVVARTMTPAQIAEARRLAQEWQPK